MNNNCKMNNNSFYNKKIGESVCLVKADAVSGYKMNNNSFYNKKIGKSVDDVKVDAVSGYKMNNKSFYNKKIGKSICDVNNFYKVTILNVKANTVSDYSMNCDDCYWSLDNTIDPSTGNVIQNICRREFGSIETDAGLYIITVWKNNTNGV